MTYLISHELAQEILNYLASQPYREVFQLVHGLQTLKEQNEDAEGVKE